MTFQGIIRIKTALAAVTLGALLAACSSGGSAQKNPTGTPVASDLIVSLSKSSITSSGADTSTLTVTAVDSSRNAVASIPVTVTPDSNAVYSTSSNTTNSSGTVSGTIGIGSDHSNRTISVVVTSGSIRKTATVTVTGATLQAATSSATPGSSATIEYHLVDGANNDMVGVPITVTAAGGTAVTGTTDGNGKYTFTYTVPNSATVSVVAKAAGVELDSTVNTTSASTAPVTGHILSASVSANPSNVQINAAGSTANQVDVRALFLGSSNTPIANARVKFDLDGDVNGIGGTITSGSNYVYSDANGVARTTYIPGSRSSGNQALTIRACWSETDFTAAQPCPNEATAAITVVANGVSLAILNNGKITPDDTKSIYAVDFAVQVVDSVGQPIVGTTVAGSVDLPRYYRGVWGVPNNSAQWAQGFFTDTSETVVLAGAQACDNEDVNRNDVLETYSNGGNEDANGSHTLEPFKASVAIIPKSTGSNVTDSFGKAYFTLQYGQNYAGWEDVVLTFTTTVQGTEGRNTYATNLPIPASALTQTNVAPPFRVSPYNFNRSGVEPAPVSVTNVVDPAPGGKTGVLCMAQP
ncbi:MAG TPA: hypothetical protein VIP05_11940 [Burkholderiaceae bacterium]